MARDRVKESMVKREGEAKRGFEKWRTGGLLWYKRHTYCREWQFQRYVSLTVNVWKIKILNKSTSKTKGGCYCAERASFWQSYIVADNVHRPLSIVHSTMSASNITPANRSTLEKYKDKYKRLREVHDAKVQENKSLKDELVKYQNEVRTLRRGFSENGVYCGRNTTSRWRK